MPSWKNKICKDSDNDKFQFIYSKYSHYLYTIGINILKDETYAADALQNCFLRIFENLEKIKDVDSNQAKSFVSIIMWNESIKIYRSKKNIDSKINSFDEALYVIDESSDVEEIFARAEIKRDIRAYLDQLNEDESNLIILKYLKEYSNEEIAKILHISQDVVRKRLSRIRKKMAIMVIRDREKEEA